MAGFNGGPWWVSSLEIISVQSALGPEAASGLPLNCNGCSRIGAQGAAGRNKHVPLDERC